MSWKVRKEWAKKYKSNYNSKVLHTTKYSGEQSNVQWISGDSRSIAQHNPLNISLMAEPLHSHLRVHTWYPWSVPSCQPPYRVIRGGLCGGAGRAGLQPQMMHGDQPTWCMQGLVNGLNHFYMFVESSPYFPCTWVPKSTSP